jgi:hypothetical protein
VGPNRPALILISLSALFLFLTSFAPWIDGEVTFLRSSAGRPGLGDNFESLNHLRRATGGSGTTDFFGPQAIEATAWDAYLALGLRIPAWVVVVLGVSLGILAGVAMGTGWTPGRWGLVGGAGFGLIFCLLFLILAGDQGQEDMIKWTTHPGLGAFCAAVAFGNMSMASWFATRPVRSGRAAPAQGPIKPRRAGPRTRLGGFGGRP